MSVRITSATAVALYDSVTDLAFGPILDSEEEADDFLTWLWAQDMDPRNLADVALIGIVKAWRDSRDH